MLFTTIVTSSILVASAIAAAEPAPYKLAKKSVNDPFLESLVKRQAGYAPTTNYCDGPGDTCASACGAGYITCPSVGDGLWCYDPDIGQSCCPDGSGNSCDEGYFCTEDAYGDTWCCPNGLSLNACAAAYSISGILISETSTLAGPTSTALQSVPTTTTKGTGGTTTSPSKNGGGVTSTSTQTVAGGKSSTTTSPVVQVTVFHNGTTVTSTSTTTSLAKQASNAAVAGRGQGMGGLMEMVMVAGVVLAL